MLIDLDEGRVRETATVRLGGVDYEVPAGLTVPLAFAAADGDLKALVDGLFGKQAGKVLKQQPPLDVTDLLKIVTALAGDAGNLPGSTG